MGYKSLIEIQIIFNKQKQDKLQQQPIKEKTKELQPDRPSTTSSSSSSNKEMHNNHIEKEKEKQRQKRKTVKQSRTSPNNSVFVFQPFPYKRNSRQFHFFIINQNRWWMTSRKLVKVFVLFSFIRRCRRYIPEDFRHLPDYGHYPELISSHRGILLFQLKGSLMHELVLIFHNPLTRQQVTATVPLKKYIFCAFFFHSPTQEYRVLYQLREDRVVSPSPSAACRYALFGIRSGSFREIVSSPCPNYCYPDTSTPPVISSGALHWMVSTEITDDEKYLPVGQRTKRSGRVYNLPSSCSEAIISFGMESEEFHVMSHPLGADDDLCTIGNSDRRHRHKMQMTLLEMDGKLCLCDGSYYRRKLDIWIMEDYLKQIWSKRYVVRLDKLLPFSQCPTDHTVVPWVKALCIHNTNKLVFQWFPWYPRGPGTHHRHYIDYMVYNLEKGGRCRTIRERPILDRKKNYHQGNLVSHTPSLENVGRKPGSVLSLYERHDGKNKLTTYDYEYQHKSKKR